MTASWDNNSTWNTLSGGINPGTDTVTPAVFSFTDRTVGPKTFTVTSSVQAWAGGANNFGWGIISDASDGFGGTNDNGMALASSENGNVGFRPQLSIDFTPVFANLDPVIDALNLPASVNFDALLNFSVDASDPGDDVLSYAWDLDGDGLFDDSTAVSGLFGPYGVALNGQTVNISVRVTDDAGGFVTQSALVSIVPEPASAGLVLGLACAFARRRRNA
jgi:hypothetical protein